MNCYNIIITEAERLAKNNQIREKGKQTRLKRKSQTCRVFRLKIDFSHLNKNQRIALKMLFVEAKWLYNDAINFMKFQDIKNYDYKIKTVHGLDKDKNPVIHDLKYLGSQMKESVIQEIKSSLKALSVSKKNKRKVGALKYKSDYDSINLQQYGVTYKFYNDKYIRLQGIGKSIKIEGAEQFFKLAGIEIANAKLLNMPDGYYLAVTTFKNKGGENKKYKSSIGIDMGIKTSITTKGSSNRYRMRKLLRKEYQKLDNKKRDYANKIVHELLEHEKVYMQDENLKGWHKGLFGRTVQHSILGLVKSKLIKHERVIILSKNIPTTKYCPNCGKVNKKITLTERTFECSCGYKEDRDIHAARNMIRKPPLL